MESVSAARAAELVREGAALVDALAPFHFEHAHLPGAINLPVHDDRFPELAAGLLPDKGRPVITYAHEGDPEAERAARRLEALGYRHVFVLAGGSKAWWDSGRAFTGDQIEATGHQV